MCIYDSMFTPGAAIIAKFKIKIGNIKTKIRIRVKICIKIKGKLRIEIRSNTKEVRSKDCPQVTLASRRNDKV